MDILHPNLTWIKGRCYRVLDSGKKYEEERIDSVYDSNDDFQIPKTGIYSVTFLFIDAQLQPWGEYVASPSSVEAGAVTNTKSSTIHSNDETCDIDFEIGRHDNGEYWTSLNIPDAIRGIVIGAKGTTRKRIQSETGAIIAFPPQGSEDDAIIRGSSREIVAAARRRMESMANSARRRHEPTHFLSLPLNCTQVIDGFTQFQNDVLDSCSMERGIVPEIFQKAQKLHLTLGTLVLLNDFERKKASRVLNGCTDRVVRPILKDKPLLIQVKGIEYMNDDPAEVDVLYAKVFAIDESDRKLQNLADQIVEEFVGAGIMHKEYNSVKLHATVMNSIFNRSYSNANSRKRRETFDARRILKLFPTFEFGECIIPSIHLSQRHSQAKNGYYAATAELALSV